MTIQLYDTHELMGVIRTIKPVNTFWLNLCFGQAQNFTSEYIDFDVLSRGRRLAPFVAPTVAGKIMRQEGYSTKRFAPAYIKPKMVFDPNRAIKRMAGEAYTGTMSPEARRNAIVADMLATMEEMRIRRMEWMACNAIVNGSVTVSGPDYPTTNVDFGRNAQHTITLTGGNQWGQAGIKPLDLLESWGERVAENSGFLPTEVIMGLDAWRVFRADADVVKALDTNFRGSSASLNLYEPAPLTPGQPWQLRGTIGTYRIWTYNDLYQNDAGTNVSLFDQKSVTMVNPQGVEGVRAFGAILDPAAGYVATEVHAKNWIENDPPAEFFMTQSAPLTVVARPDASLTAKVLV